MQYSFNLLTSSLLQNIGEGCPEGGVRFPFSLTRRGVPEGRGEVSLLQNIGEGCPEGGVRFPFSKISERGARRAG
jgi:hypothetical protein